MIPRPTPRRGLACPSDLDLDELLARDLAEANEARLRGHLEGCADCRARLAAFTAVAPPGWKEISARQPSFARPARPRRWLPALGVATAALAALVLVARPRPTPGPGARTKGTLALTVIVKRATGGVETLADGAPLRAGDEIRFSAASAKPGYAVVLGLDAAPAVTVYLPASGATPVAIAAGSGQVLPGSIVADATPGTERLVLLRCDAQPEAPLLRETAARALAAAGGRPERVGPLGTGCDETSVLVHKAPPR
jgi:hypothetical protein